MSRGQSPDQVRPSWGPETGPSNGDQCGVWIDATPPMGWVAAIPPLHPRTPQGGKPFPPAQAVACLDCSFLISICNLHRRPCRRGPSQRTTHREDGNPRHHYRPSSTQTAASIVGAGRSNHPGSTSKDQGMQIPPIFHGPRTCLPYSGLCTRTELKKAIFGFLAHFCPFVGHFGVNFGVPASGKTTFWPAFHPFWVPKRLTFEAFWDTRVVTTDQTGLKTG